MPDHNNIALRDAVEQYTESLGEQKLSTTTIACSVQQLREWIDWVEDAHDATQVSDIRPHHLTNYADHRDGDLCAVTIRARLLVVYRFLQHLGDRDYIDNGLLLRLDDALQEVDDG